MHNNSNKNTINNNQKSNLNTSKYFPIKCLYCDRNPGCLILPCRCLLCTTCLLLIRNKNHLSLNCIVCSQEFDSKKIIDLSKSENYNRFSFLFCDPGKLFKQGYENLQFKLNLQAKYGQVLKRKVFELSKELDEAKSKCLDGDGSNDLLNFNQQNYQLNTFIDEPNFPINTEDKRNTFTQNPHNKMNLNDSSNTSIDRSNHFSKSPETGLVSNIFKVRKISPKVSPLISNTIQQKDISIDNLNNLTVGKMQNKNADNSGERQISGLISNDHGNSNNEKGSFLKENNKKSIDQKKSNCIFNQKPIILKENTLDQRKEDSIFKTPSDFNKNLSNYYYKYK